MAGEWPTAAVRDVTVRVTKGTTPTTIGGQFAGHGINFVKVESITESGHIEQDKLAHIDEHSHALLSRSVLEEDDILFTIAGTIGRVALVPASLLPANTNQAVAIVRPDQGKVLPRFLYYVLGDESRVRQAHTRVVQSVQANFSLAELSSLEIPLPDLNAQRAIAHILGTLDDKIELNRRMSETMEAMARALFKSWFVDFDPVRAKVEGRGSGRPQPLADLFPDSLENSELGEVPSGWEVRPLRDLASYLSRGIGPSYVESGGVCVLNQKCIRDRRIDFSKARRHDPAKKPTHGRLVRRLDVLVNSTGVGTLGRAAQLWHVPEPSIVDSHVTMVRAAPEVDPWFFGVGLTGREIEIEALSEGSTGQTELSRIRLGDLPCLAPPIGVQKQFGRIASHLLERVSSAQRESTTLESLRGALLPKLISGEMRVEDSARFLGAAY